MQLCEESSEAPVWTLPMKLFFVGFFLAFIGFIVLMIATALQGNSSISGGLIIFIGPVPIILGSGPYSVFAILLAVILTIIGFIVFFLLRKQNFRGMAGYTWFWVWVVLELFLLYPISHKGRLTPKRRIPKQSV